MENFLDADAHFDMNELVSDMLAKLLVLEVNVKCLTAFQRAFIEKFAPTEEIAQNLRLSFETVLEDQMSKMKNDNPVINKILQDLAKRNLSDIGGIHFTD